jgi:hypothetical protein
MLFAAVREVVEGVPPRKRVILDLDAAAQVEGNLRRMGISQCMRGTPRTTI